MNGYEILAHPADKSDIEKFTSWIITSDNLSYEVAIDNSGTMEVLLYDMSDEEIKRVNLWFVEHFSTVNVSKIIS